MELVAYDRAQVKPAKVKELLATAVFNPTGERLNAILSNVYSSPANKLFLLTHEGQALGLVGVRRVGDAAAEILHIAVDAGTRQQGIGRRMIDELLRVEALSELVAETDQDAVGFYRRCGFVVKSLGEKYPGTERFLCSLRQRG